ncbi:TadE/TadG family type IV pilus assembly protein [Fusibacter sp. 3D3]|uniref:TadE/TadG family type IV pilus assembly protein n=1 Tax=Fusibacter sp. 3D3 TaxID=1048380 RepID=UPI0008533549|nr:hypothetical protein [Fusibacter sp. 3D3]GAU76350.1 hypothetical protein F3D3_0947 [Fusibacter sp. 3D3]
MSKGNKWHDFVKEEKGATALISIMMMFVLLAFAGLIIDCGYVVYSKIGLDEATMQASDSAILAVDNDYFDETGEVEIIIEDAADYIEYVLLYNLPDAILISVEADPIKPNIVEVYSQRTVPVHFSKILGINEVTIYSKAICKVDG